MVSVNNSKPYDNEADYKPCECCKRCKIDAFDASARNVGFNHNPCYSKVCPYIDGVLTMYFVPLNNAGYV